MTRTRSAVVSTIAVTLPVVMPLLTGRRRILRGVALVVTAATAGLSMAHVLEMPAKRRLPLSQWWWLTNRLYRPWFGRAGHAEGVALLAVPALGAVSPASRPAALIATALLAVANPVLFFTLVAPTNRATLESPEHPPKDCQRLRDHWEFGHLARFLCHALAFVVLAGEAALHHREEQ